MISRQARMREYARTEKIFQGCRMREKLMKKISPRKNGYIRGNIYDTSSNSTRFMVSFDFVFFYLQVEIQESPQF